MARVLPYVQSPLEQLMPYIGQLGQGVGAIGEKFAQKRAVKELQELEKKGSGTALPSDGNSGDVPQNIVAGQNVDTGISPVEFARRQKLAEKAYGKEGGKAYGDALLQQQKLQQKEAQEIRKEERAIGVAGSKDFFERVESDRLKIPEEKLATEMIMDSILSGEIDPWSSAHIGEIAKSFGAPESLTKILETPGSKEFKTARKTFIGNTIKDAFKGTTTKIEINLAEDMLSELGVSEEANLASAWGLQAALEIREQRIRLTDQLREQGVSPSKIPATVDKMLQPFRKELHDEYFEAIRSLRKENK